MQEVRRGVEVDLVDGARAALPTFARHVERDQQDRLAAVGQVAAGVAHDFNNIVTAINLYVGMLESQAPLDASAREHLMCIRSQTERAVGLTWQILNLAQRPAAERMEVELRPFLADLEGVLRRMVGPGVRVLLEVAVPSPVVIANPSALEQIFTNLATNAGDALDAGGDLTIRAEIEDGLDVFDGSTAAGSPRRWVRIDVSDTGAGIPEQLLARIFEPFFTTKPPGRGTGLGLSQVHALVTQYEGHVEVRSLPGEGTRVSIWFPAGDGHLRRSPTPVSEPPRGHGEVILVVDDDPVLRGAIAEVLHSLAYNPLEAGAGEEVLQLLERRRDVSAVVSATMMPDIGGEALALAIKARWPTVAVVLTTSFPAHPPATDGLRSKEVRDGQPAVARLRKPFTARQLGVVLREVLGRAA